MFEVVKLPRFIWTAYRKPRNNKKNTIKMFNNNLVYLNWQNKIVTFSDLSRYENSLRQQINLDSIQFEQTSTWINDEIKNKVLVQLLNKELSFFARKLGLKETFKKNRFFKKIYTKNFILNVFQITELKHGNQDLKNRPI
jgi:hypothetical protein